MWKATEHTEVEHDKARSNKKIGYYIPFIGIVVIGALLYFCSNVIDQFVTIDHPNDIQDETVTWSK